MTTQLAPKELWDDNDKFTQTGKTTLAYLLAHPPHEGGRNNWLTQVAGFYAKLLPFEDAFDQTVRSLAPAGLDDDEVDKLIRSIWTREQEQKGKAVPVPEPEGEGGNWRVKEPTESTGWLASGDVRILARCRRKDGDGFREVLEPWLNADLRVMGIFLMPDDSRTYHLEVRPTDGENFEVDLPSYRIGNSTRLREWLAGQGLGLAAPESLWPRGMGDSSRMTRYLESQGAPVQRAANSLGWHDIADGFLTHEGVLRVGGEFPFDGVRPHPRVKEWAPYRYGLRDGAAAALREALTFHFPEVTSVFGAWWAACFLKPQISRIFSQFPFMAIEASSESGKSEPLTNQILTPTGWRQMGELEIGDLVIGSDGKPTQITGIWPQGVTPTVEVVLRDGARVRCSPEHLWRVYVHGTAQIMEASELQKICTQKYVQIDVLQNPVVYENTPDLPITPYAFGILLGDGSFVADFPILTLNLLDRNEILRDFTDYKINSHSVRISSHTLRRNLRLLGLWGAKSDEKFIPTQYLTASIDDRYELVQGLMDTDGYCAKNGACEFCSTSQEMASQFLQLIRSLGGKGTISSKQPKDRKLAWQVRFTLPKNPFRIKRKAQRWKLAPHRKETRGVREVIDTEPCETQCITVSATDNLYVTGGDGFVLTHNSTGFFPIMLELGGNTLGKSIPTKAAMRDYLSAHRNGIVWVDDVDDVQPYGELIRSTTVEGSVVKKGSDHQSQMAVQLQAALVLTGESLGLGRQKALADRCVDLRVPSPVGRQSLRGNYSQWEDIVSFKAEHVLTDYAGSFVIEALRHADELAKKSKRWRVGKGGRTADTMTIMRIGAWLLEILSEKDDHQIEQDVEQWIASHGARYSPYDNTLTTVLLPQALARLGIKKEPEGPDVFRKSVATPVFVTGREGKGTPKVWFSPKLLAAWWRDLHYGRIEQRTESEESIVEQARACNAGGTKRKYFYYNTGDGGTKYWRLPDDLGKKVLARAEGVEE